MRLPRKLTGLGGWLRWALLALAALAMCSCETMGTIADVASSAGLIKASEADALRKGFDSGAKLSQSALKAFDSFTPEQVYYLGRSVGAMILNQYQPYQATAVNHYLNLLGQSLALASDLPEIFGGYRFLVLDSEEINAFASPGGHIFITRGLLRCCRSEDAVAAILAHEIGHVQLEHGLKAIRQSRRLDLIKLAANEAVSLANAEGVAQTVSLFQDCIMDVTDTLVRNGYSRDLEFEADQAAVTILNRLGYRPEALVEMLQTMAGNLNPKGLDFAKTHPSPQDRIANLKKLGSGTTATPGKAELSARQKRFQQALGTI